MSSLTETAYYTRRIIMWLGIALVGYIILRIAWSLFFGLWLIVFPPKPLPPTNAFGKLPALKFPAPTASPSGQLVFSLQTISGSIPTASAAAAVYFMPKTPANLLALNTAQNLAARLGFDTTPIQESKNIYRFNDPKFPFRNFRYDIVSNNFILRYAFERDPSVFSEHVLPQTDSAIGEAKTLLQTYNLYPDDLAQGTTTVIYLKLSGSTLGETTSLSQADAIRIDFYRRNVGQMRLFTPYPGEGPISVIFSGSTSQNKHLLQFAYTYWPIDYQTSATYALKTSQAAWEELQSGGGYIAQYPFQSNQAVVRNVYLGYYDSFDPQTYLQPIFVFEGDNGFLAFVPAVSEEWIEQ